MTQENFIHNIKNNIIGKIKRSDINVADPKDLPKDAMYAFLNPSEEFIQKFYKITPIKFNDNTTGLFLQYWSEQQGWYNSAYNVGGCDHDKFKNCKILEIVEEQS